MARVNELIKIGMIKNTSKGTSDWFSEDLEIHGSQNTLCNIKLMLVLDSTDAKIQINFNGGSDWVYLNNGDDIKQDVIYTTEFYVDASDTINFKADKTVTVRYLAIGGSEHA